MGTDRYCRKCGTLMDFRLGEYVCPNCGLQEQVEQPAEDTPKLKPSGDHIRGLIQPPEETGVAKPAVSSWQRTELPGFEAPPEPGELPTKRSAAPMVGEKRAFLGIAAFIMIVLQVFISMAETGQIQHSRKDTFTLILAGTLTIVMLLALYSLALFIKERGVKVGMMIFNGLCIILGIAFAIGLSIDDPFVMQILIDVNFWALPKSYCIAFLMIHAGVMAWLVQILYQDATGMATGD